MNCRFCVSDDIAFKDKRVSPSSRSPLRSLISGVTDEGGGWRGVEQSRPPLPLDPTAVSCTKQAANIATGGLVSFCPHCNVVMIDSGLKVPAVFSDTHQVDLFWRWKRAVVGSLSGLIKTSPHCNSVLDPNLEAL